MAEIKDIIAHDGFIEVIFSGAVLRGFPNRNAYLERMLAACQENECDRVMENLQEIEYTPDRDILAEHEWAEYLMQPRFRAIKWAYLMPKAAQRTNIHLENTAVNRGVRLRTFLDRDAAIAWLLGE